MKHIKIYEQLYFDYFKDKINWKFLNFLMDKLTKYEDIGCKTSIAVYLNDGHEQWVPLITYINGEESFKRIEIADRLVEYYNKFGIYYYIGIYEKGSNSLKADDYEMEYLEIIKDKCNFVKQIGYLSSIMVKPK